MDEGKMVQQVNGITKFFLSFPHEEAVRGVADHIRMFWEPRFRRQLDEYTWAGGHGLLPVSIEAIESLRDPAEVTKRKPNPRSVGLPDPAGPGDDAG
jgi:formate dehydrogenase subunit delta